MLAATDWINTTKKQWISRTPVKSIDMATARHDNEDLAIMSSRSDAMLDALENNPSPEVVSKICAQLVELYRARDKQLTMIVNQFIPSLIYLYLTQFRTQDCMLLETCILTLYNLNVMDEGGNPVSHTIIVPTLNKNSVFHEAPTAIQLTEKEMKKQSQTERHIILGPFPQIEKVNSHNRMSVLSLLIRRYSRQIGILSQRSHRSVCDTAIRLCSMGFSKSSHHTHKNSPSSSHSTSSHSTSFSRIPLNDEFLLELLHCVYFVMFNTFPEQGLQALECIHQRAQYDLFSKVLIVTNAIKNSLEHNPSGQPRAGPMGVSIALTPANVLSNLNRQAITNASFKTQKLPDDITMVNSDEESVTSDPPSRRASANHLLSNFRLNAGTLKSALKKVERHVSKKSDSTSPSKQSDKHIKLSSSLKNKDTKTDKLQVDGHPYLGHAKSDPQAFYDAQDVADSIDVKTARESTSLDAADISIIIDPPHVNDATATSSL